MEAARRNGGIDLRREEGLGALLEWVEATTGQWVLLGRLERMTEHLPYVRQGEKVLAWWQWTFLSKPAAAIARCCEPFGLEEGPNRLETLRRLVLHLASQSSIATGAVKGKQAV